MVVSVAVPVEVTLTPTSTVPSGQCKVAFTSPASPATEPQTVIMAKTIAPNASAKLCRLGGHIDFLLFGGRLRLFGNGRCRKDRDCLNLYDFLRLRLQPCNFVSNP